MKANCAHPIHATVGPDVAIAHCECGTPFCGDHGSIGGDVEGGTNINGSPYGAYAVPSQCYRCGGFNADE